MDRVGVLNLHSANHSFGGNMKSFITSIAACLLALPMLVKANTPIDIIVHGNKVEATISLPGGIETDLSISFENSLGLTKESVGITAELIDVTDLGFLNRLPSTLSSVPLAFPMMITIEPPSTMGLGFNGVAKIDIHTHNLEYTPNTPLRLFKASLGQAFRDITVTTGAGSYRARGHMGEFSQFIVAADFRDVDTVVATKLTRLQNLVSDHYGKMTSLVAAEVDALVSQAAVAIANGNKAKALRKLSKLKKVVAENRGEHIPDVWRSSRDITNVAGVISAQADTLSYSLRLSI